MHTTPFTGPSARSFRKSCHALFLLTCIAMACNSAEAQESYGQNADIRAFGSAWTALFEYESSKAEDVITRLTQSSRTNIRWHALHLKARSLWLQGDQASKQQAMNIWTGMEREVARSGGNAYVTARLGIARALHLSDRKREQQAIAVLEGITRLQLASVVTVEAIIELVHLHAALGGREEALRLLEIAENMLVDSESYDIPRELRSAYRRGLREARQAIEDSGRVLFLRAMGLMREKRYEAAISAFNDVVRGFPDSDYAHRSQLQIGTCHFEQGRIQPAVAQWRRFVEASPAGPWRAQALVRLMDTYTLLYADFAQALGFAEIAMQALTSVSDGESVDETWNDALFGLHIRIGIVFYIHGEAQKAITALKQADGVASRNFDYLVKAIESGRPLIPDDCRLPRGEGATNENTTRASNLLAAGMILFLTGHPNSAELAFDRVLGVQSTLASKQPSPLPGVTTPQLAFSAFGKGWVLQSRELTKEALIAYRRSHQLYADGSWHDETLYRIAAGIQAIAASELGGNIAGDDDAGKALLLARSTALPYLRKIVESHRNSPRYQHALYQCGVLLYDMAHANTSSLDSPTASPRSTRLWQESFDMFDQLHRHDPNSNVAGEAYVRQIDIALERTFDLALADNLSKRAVEWLLSDGTEAAPAKVATLDRHVWHEDTAPLSSRNVRNTLLREVYRRAGVIAYLQNSYAESIELFRKSNRLTTGRSDRFVAEGQISTGMDLIISMARQQKALTPPEARVEGTHATLILQIADIYHAMESYDRAIELADLVIHSKTGVTHEQKSWAFFKRGRSRYAMDRKTRDTAAASQDFRAAADAAPRAPWADTAILLAANIAFNIDRDTDRAVQQWRRLIREYPESREAHRSAYYIGVAYEVAGRAKEARTAYEAFLRQYPDSPFVRLVQTVHLERVALLERGAEVKK